MPFKSEKQRRYMHTNLPGIAKRWERKYGNAIKRRIRGEQRTKRSKNS